MSDKDKNLVAATMKSDFDGGQLVEVLAVLRQAIETSVKASDIGTKSMTPLKAMVVRETLLWRIVELGDGVILCLDAGNALCAAILARASFECSAVHHQLNRKIQAAKDMTAVKLDDEIMRLLLGSRNFSTGDTEEDEKIRMTNIQTCLDKLDKKFKGSKDCYERLCEYAHPNWAGTAGLFSSGNPTEGVITLDRYTRNADNMLQEEAINCTTAALVMFVDDYSSILDHLQGFFKACDRQ